jgi:hypothetical protein
LDELKKRKQARRWSALEKSYEENGEGWLPLGDKRLILAVLDEIEQFARAPLTTKRRATAALMIIDIASSFLRDDWFEETFPYPSRTEERQALRRISSATRRLHELLDANLGVMDKAMRCWPKRGIRFWAMMHEGLPVFHDALAAALATPKFQRKGRTESTLNAHVVLVLRTRALMERFAGREPGFARETAASSGPLARTVNAIYHFAAGEPAISFDRYIAQAEQLSKKMMIWRSVVPQTNKPRASL